MAHQQQHLVSLACLLMRMRMSMRMSMHASTV